MKSKLRYIEAGHTSPFCKKILNGAYMQKKIIIHENSYVEVILKSCLATLEGIVHIKITEEALAILKEGISQLSQKEISQQIPKLSVALRENLKDISSEQKTIHAMRKNFAKWLKNNKIFTESILQINFKSENNTYYIEKSAVTRIVPNSYRINEVSFGWSVPATKAFRMKYLAMSSIIVVPEEPYRDSINRIGGLEFPIFTNFFSSKKVALVCTKKMESRLREYLKEIILGPALKDLFYDHISTYKKSFYALNEEDSEKPIQIDQINSIIEAVLKGSLKINAELIDLCKKNRSTSELIKKMEGFVLACIKKEPEKNISPDIVKKIAKAYIEAYLMKRECQHVSTGTKDVVKTIDDFVDFITFDEEGRASLPNKTTICRTEKNVFDNYDQNGNFIGRVDMQEVEPLKPLFDLPKKIPQRGDLSIEFTGTGTGTSKDNDSQGAIIWYRNITTKERQGIMVDPNIQDIVKLNRRGESATNIPYVIITHIHEDHVSGLLEIITSGRRINLITTPVIWNSYKRAIAILLQGEKELASAARKDIEKIVNFIAPDENNKIYLNEEGLEIEMTKALHTIPTIGFELTYKSEDKKYLLAFSGDTKFDPEYFKTLLNDFIITEDRYKELNAFLTKDRNVTIADGGGQVDKIHTDPRTLLRAQEHLGRDTNKTYFIHRDPSLPQIKRAKGQPQFVIDGEVVIVKENPIREDEIDTALNIIKKQLLFKAIPEEELKTLLPHINIKHFHQGEMLIRENSSDKSVYFLADGAVRVSRSDYGSKVIFVYPGTGGCVGASAPIKDKLRNANVEAASDVTCIEITENIFNDFYEKNKKIIDSNHDNLIKKELLESFPDLFYRFSDETLKTMVVKYFPGDPKIYDSQNPFTIKDKKSDKVYFIISGKLAVVIPNEDNNTVKLGWAGIEAPTIIGEKGAIEDIPSGATVIAHPRAIALEISNKKFLELCEEFPAFRLLVRQLTEDRQEMNEQGLLERNKQREAIIDFIVERKFFSLKNLLKFANIVANNNRNINSLLDKLAFLNNKNEYNLMFDHIEDDIVKLNVLYSNLPKIKLNTKLRLSALKSILNCDILAEKAKAGELKVFIDHCLELQQFEIIKLFMTLALDFRINLNDEQANKQGGISRLSMIKSYLEKNQNFKFDNIQDLLKCLVVVSDQDFIKAMNKIIMANGAL